MMNTPKPIGSVNAAPIGVLQVIEEVPNQLPHWKTLCYCADTPRDIARNLKILNNPANVWLKTPFGRRML